MDIRSLEIVLRHIEREYIEPCKPIDPELEAAFHDIDRDVRALRSAQADGLISDSRSPERDFHISRFIDPWQIIGAVAAFQMIVLGIMYVSGAFR